MRLESAGQGRPQREELARDAQQSALMKVFDIVRQVRRVRLKEPAHMGMPEAAQQSKKTIALLVRRMGVFVRVAVLVVTPMHGDPFQERAFDRHRAEDGQYKLDHPIGFKGPVGKQSVVADGDSDGRQHVHPQQQPAIDPMEAPAPK